MPHLHALTSLRAFLASWVLLRHLFHRYDGRPAFFDTGSASLLFEKGYLGVDGFFILSGFILAYNYGDGRLRGSVRDFLAARLARIYPVHLACLGAAMALVIVQEFAWGKTLLGQPGHSIPELLRSLALVQAWTLGQLPTSWNDVSWSVSAEWFAYLCFPVFAYLGGRRGRVAPLAWMALSLLALAWLEQANQPRQLSLPGGLGRLIPEFMLGVLLHRLRPALLRTTGHGARAGSLLSLCLCAAGLLLDIDTVVVAGIAALILSLSLSGDLLARPLGVRPLVYLGEVSYCLYMVQRFPQEIWGWARARFGALDALPLSVQLPVYAAFLLAAAMLLHHAVEVPMRPRLRAWLSRAGRAQVSAA